MILVLISAVMLGLILVLSLMLIGFRFGLVMNCLWFDLEFDLDLMVALSLMLKLGRIYLDFMLIVV